jgi:hypothetical protein
MGAGNQEEVEALTILEILTAIGLGIGLLFLLGWAFLYTTNGGEAWGSFFVGLLIIGATLWGKNRLDR